MIRIGVLGLAFRSPDYIGGNLGCYALGDSFFEILSKIAKNNNEDIEVVIIQPYGLIGLTKRTIKRVLGYKDYQIPYYKEQYPYLSFSRGFYFLEKSVFIFGNSIKQCDCVFDFTAGDSFTDIYGEERFYTRTRVKKEIIKLGVPLILGSQTIGPFKDSKVEKYAVDVIEHSREVYVRDLQSKSYVETISNVSPVLTTDVAFFLPFRKSPIIGKNKTAGFNPSGLLWMGGYAGENQFGLTVDYQKYCKTVISFLIENGFEVHLIMHAYYLEDIKGEYHADNDRLAVEALHDLYPMTVLSPSFSSPMEAKSYISGMDLFIGARMHATIAAISAGVPVIPFSYSRKFEGLFSSLNYPFVVEGTKWDTDKAINTTCEWINKLNELKQSVESCERIIDEKNDILLSHYSNTIINLKTRYKND